MRHILSKPLAVLLAMLILTVSLPALALRLVDAANPLPAAYCLSSEPDGDAEKLASLLDADGLVRFASPEEMTNQISSGTLSMGIIVPGNLGAHFSVNDFDGALTLVTAQPSALEVLQKTEIMSALYEVLAPYITYDSLEASGFSFEKDEVFSSYEAMVNQGLLFRFEQTSVEGTAIESVKRPGIFRLVLGLMLWTGMLLGVCMPACGRVRALAPAIGSGRAWKSIGIPGVLLGAGLMGAAAVLSCALCGFGKLAVSALVCLAAMGLLGLMICLAFPGNQLCTIVCIFLGALAPALCPALVDISLFIPIIEKVRIICPVYWLWI